MAFEFSLETVLRFRESVEKREELALEKILAEMAIVRRQAEEVGREIENARELLDQAMREMLPAVHLEAMTERIEAAVARKKELIASLAELDRQREIQTAKYQAARYRRQMLSDMRAQQHQAYEQERDRAEQKFLDDIFAARAQRS